MKDDDPILARLAARVREERNEEELPKGVKPFDAGVEERITDLLVSEIARVEEELRESEEVEAAAEVGPDGETFPAPDHDQAPEAGVEGAPEDRPAAPATVVRPLRWAWAAAPLAAAAAAVLYISMKGPPVEIPPSYDMGLVSANSVRSDPKLAKTDVTLDPEGDVELVARPVAPAKGIGARTVLIRDGVAKPWHPPLEISDEGSLRISGKTKDLFVPAEGTYEIVVFVGKVAFLPAEADAVRASKGSWDNLPYRVLRAKIHFVEKK